MSYRNFSVLLSVYHKEVPEYLDLALKSIVEQSYEPNEIVLIKDGPLTPDLDATIYKWQDLLNERLKIVPINSNVGLAIALNSGLEYCQFDIVARMDTDDVSLPERFKMQFDFLEKNKHISCVGALVEERDESLTHKVKVRHVPEKHQDIVRFCQRRNPISHPVAMFRKTHVLSVGGYPDVYPEDYFLWLKMIQSGYKFANIQEVLLNMRTGNNFVSRRGYKFLKGEVKIYNFMLVTGFIGFWKWVTNVAIRAVVRLSPRYFKVLFYRLLR